MNHADDKGQTRINVVDWLSRTTLDIIGLAGNIHSFIKTSIRLNRTTGFDYTFNALGNTQGSPSELQSIFNTVFRHSGQLRVWSFLQESFPSLRIFVRGLHLSCYHHNELNFSLKPARGQGIARTTRRKMQEIGEKLLDERRAVFAQEKPGTKGPRDLLTLLLKANMDPNIPDSQRLSDEDVIARRCF